MSLSITLPSQIQDRVQDIAARKGKAVEGLVIEAVLHYIAHEQPAIPISDTTAALEQSQRLYQGFKARLRQRYPALRDLPRKQVVATMDRLAEKAAEGIPYATWQEAEAFMRGEDRYDFARQQYLHH